MIKRSIPQTARLLRIVAMACGAYALIGGAVSFAGWPLDLQRLTDWLNLGVSIQPNAAMLMTLAGAAILLLHVRREGIAMALGAVIALVGGLTLMQYIVGADFGFNHQLSFGRQWGQATTLTRGRMGPPASTSFSLIGASLVILAWSQRGSARANAVRRVVPIAALLVCIFMLFSLIGYLFDAREFYTIPWLTAIALQTASMLMALAVALLVSVPEAQPVRLLHQQSNAAMLARFVLPLLIVLPILVSWFRIEGESMGLYDKGTGRALAVVVLIIIAVTLMWRALLVLAVREQREIEAAQQLRQSETRLRSIIEQLPAGVGVMDRHGTWTLTNSTMDLYVPTAIPSAISQRSNRWRAWDESGKPISSEQWPGLRALRGESVVPGLEMLYSHDDGREIWMRVSAAPLRDDAGQVVGAACVVQDVDLPRRFRMCLEEELNHRTAELTALHEQIRRNEAMAILGSLSTGIAHDLGNLLLPLHTRLGLLEGTQLTQEQREHVEALGRSVRYIRDLAGRLRSSISSVALDQNGGSRPHDALVDLNKWCRRTDVFLRGIIPPPIVLHCDVPHNLPSLALNEVGLTQAVYNLVQNAVKAIRTSGVGSKIVLRAQRHGGAVELLVQDDGPGMSEETLKRCTEPAFTTDPDQSMGLGLSLVRSFIAGAGGTLAIVSPPPADGDAAARRGTAVSLRFPLPRATPRSSAALKVACADDYQDILELMRRAIDAAPDMACVCTFGDAQSLLNWLDRASDGETPDILVMDWSMPGLATAEAIRRINQRWPDIRVVVYTSHPAPMIRSQAMQVGASEVVEKSEGVPALLVSLRRCAAVAASGASA